MNISKEDAEKMNYEFCMGMLGIPLKEAETIMKSIQPITEKGGLIYFKDIKVKNNPNPDLTVSEDDI